jgi:hypothetical protein
MLSPFKLLNQLIYFYEFGVSVVLLRDRTNLIRWFPSCVTTSRLTELVRWKRHQCDFICSPAMMCSNFAAFYWGTFLWKVKRHGWCFESVWAFGLMTATTELKMALFWVVAPCSLVVWFTNVSEVLAASIIWAPWEPQILPTTEPLEGGIWNLVWRS